MLIKSSFTFVQDLHLFSSYALKTKLIISFSLMVFFAVLIETFDLIYIQRPHNYAVEAKSDEKDILRINNAFESMANDKKRKSIKARRSGIKYRAVRAQRFSAKKGREKGSVRLFTKKGR